MTFDEAIKYVKENSFIQSYEDIYEYNHVTDLDDVIEILEKLKKEYAPTVEMTKEQYEVWNVSLKKSQEHKGDFIYFIDVLDDESSFQDNVFREKLEYFINDSKPLMQAWLHPEDIQIIDKE